MYSINKNIMKTKKTLLQKRNMAIHKRAEELSITHKHRITVLRKLREEFYIEIGTLKNILYCKKTQQEFKQLSIF